MVNKFEHIAIIGMAGRFPGANSIDELYELLKEGRDHVDAITEERLVSTTLPLDGNYVTGGFLSDVDKFDYKFFNYAPVEAISMDPHIRLAIENTYHCFEDAGYAPSFFNETNTMVVASTASLNYYKHADEFDPALVTGNQTSFLTAAISRKFGLQGASIVIDTSCSSGLSALQVACDALNQERSSYALVIGASIFLFPEKSTDNGLGLDSINGKSRSFSAKADGMSYGEAVSAILLKPLKKALENKDHIYATIRGVNGNNNANRSSSPTAPDHISQSNLLIETWTKAEVNPRDIGFVEAHGSGTLLGDSIEMFGLNEAFKAFTSENHFCSLSTIKTNIGHTRNASGVVGIIKTVLSVNRGKLFPILHFTEPSTMIDFKNSAVKIQEKFEDWIVKEGSKRLAGVTSIGFSGSNFHALIEEAPTLFLKTGCNNDSYLITVSALSKEGLIKKIKQLDDLSLEKVALADISFTLLSGRDHFSFRKAAIIQDKQGFKKFTSEFVFEEGIQFKSKKQVRVNFLAIQTGKINVEYGNYLKKNYADFNKIFQSCLELAEDENNLYAIEFAHQYSLFRLLEKAGITPHVIIGIGTGEWILKIANGLTTIQEAMKGVCKVNSIEIEEIAKRTQAMLEREKENGLPFFVDLGFNSPIGKELNKINRTDDSFVAINFSEQPDPLLQILSKWYEHGGSLNAEYISNLSNGKKISLPLYPFEKTRCWLRQAPRVVKKTDQIIKEHQHLVETKDDIERTINNLWEQILQINEISPEANFFELGGDSLGASKVVIQLNQLYDLNLDFEDVFDFPTIFQFSKFIKSQFDNVHRLKVIWKKVLKVDNVQDQDHFFEMGGHSLLANNLINGVVKEFKIKINFEDIFSHPTFKELLQFIESRSFLKMENSFTEIVRAPEQEFYPLSPSQHRLWILSQMEVGNVAYNIPAVLKLEGSLAILSFEWAVNKLIERHEILRTVFRANGSGKISQFILHSEAAKFQVAYFDLRQEQNKALRTKEEVEKSFHHVFDLSMLPLFSVNIIQTEDNQWILTYVMHHIISDDWSMNILINELLTLYNSHFNNTPVSLPGLQIQFRDFTLWQEKQLSGELLLSHRSYWLEQFTGDIPVLELIGDKVRPSIKTYNGGEPVYKEFNHACFSGLKNLNKESGTTRFMGVFSLVNALLHKYTFQEDIVIGSPVANRDHADVENQIGFYANTLALRTRFNKNDSFSKLLSNVREVILGAFKHQVYPFDSLVSDLHLRRDMSRNPLFDVQVILQHNKIEEEQKMEGLLVQQFDETKKDTSRFDLVFIFNENEKGLRVCIEYNNDIYKRETIIQLSDHLEQLLEAAIKKPNEPLNELQYLNAAEIQKQVMDFNASDLFNPVCGSLVSLFESQVLQHPDKIAVVYNDVNLTYAELNKRSNQLAHYLLSSYKLSPDSLIGIMMDRSANMLIAILGILKAGCAYVPIDPSYPAARISYILEDTALSILISETANIFDLDYFQGSIIAIDVQLEEMTGSVLSPDILIHQRDLAYVIYTSGSTGKPKGVMVEHGGIVNTIFNQIESFGITSNSRGLQFASLSFDASVSEIFIMLCSGGCVYIVPDSIKKSPEALEDYIYQNRINVLTLPPSYLKLLDRARLQNVKHVITAGEVAIAEDAKWYGSQSNFYNAYGPTEGSICATIYKVDPDLQKSMTVPIGKPLPNTEVYVLDENKRPVALGVAGEIYLGGAGLARGYLNQPDLTSSKFIPNPYKIGSRIYRTGDLGRFLPSGMIEYLGRKDEQVKIRGYRIELAEIESALLSYSNVDAAAVVVKTNKDGVKDLVAYVVCREELNISLLQQHLNTYLPTFMIPVYFRQLPKLPLTINGKIDRKALPELNDSSDLNHAGYVTPRDETEASLAALWGKILEQKNIGAKDDFFLRGGHSLSAIRLLNSIHKEFGVKLQIADLFTFSILEVQAQLIKETIPTLHEIIPLAAVEPNYILSSSQHRIWLLSHLEEGNKAYSIPGACTFEGDLKREVLESSFQTLIDRHEILRSTFNETETGEPRQFIHTCETIGFELEYENFQDSSNQIKDSIEAYFDNPFDLRKGPLLRAKIYQVEKNKWIFAYAMHHIISDGWSMEILIKELLIVYNSYLKGETNPLPPLRIQHKDYAVWQRLQLTEDALKLHKSYWFKKFEGEMPALELPTDKARSGIKMYRGGIVRKQLNNKSIDILRKIVQAQGSTLFMGLLASVNALIYRYSGQEDIVIGSPVAGRGHSDLADQIGFYVNTLALRNRFNGRDSYNELLEIIKDNTLEAYEHKMYPFDELVEGLSLQRSMNRHPLFDVMVTLQNTASGDSDNTRLTNLKVSDYESSLTHTASKFDLTFTFTDDGSAIYLSLEYDSDLYYQLTARSIASHLDQLIASIASDPKLSIQKLDFLSAEEKQQLLIGFNNTITEYPKDKTIIDLFEEQAKKRPDNIAVIFEERNLTYRELDERSGQLANYLIEQYHVNAGDAIGIILDRSEMVIISILSILKTGAFYVPIDPEYPLKRKTLILKDAEVKVLITQTDYLFDVEGYNGNVFAIDIQLNDLATSISLPERQTTSNELVYVMYTSGSTGIPKGVMVTQSGITRLVKNTNYVSINANDSILSLSNFSFDGSTFDIYAALLNGGKLVITPKETFFDFAAMDAVIIKNEVTMFFVTTALFNSFSESEILTFKTIKKIFFGGEIVSVGHVKKMKEKHKEIELVHLYGPTENTTYSTWYAIDHIAADCKTIPIGKPISNTQVYILDECFNLSPIGVGGKIYLGGDGLAKGYLNNIRLSKERFLSNPFSPDKLIYDTGDIGRWLPDGNIEFIGRKDGQVKIRGHRIELEEIESCLLNFELIDLTVAVVRDNKLSGEKEIIAYIVGKEQLDLSKVHEYMDATVPFYMKPNHICQLSSIPLNANGKIDKDKLPDPINFFSGNLVEYVDPRTPAEEALVLIWKELFGKTKVSVKDNFFDSGGSSLLAIRFITRVQNQINVDLSIKDVFQNPVLESIAGKIDSIVWLRNNAETSDENMNTETLTF